ncbi:MAG TPA: hypothetical protein VJ205_02730 [Gammaproteobacteria bacterium]|nr:hypothetical protein [Gammaproteobacteria bacterium]
MSQDFESIASNYTSGRSAWFGGLTPSFMSLMALLVTGAAIAGVGALGGWFVGFFPLYAKILGAIFGITTFNYWFARNLQSVYLAAKPLKTETTFHQKNPIRLEKMVRYLCALLTEHHKSQHPKDVNFQMPMPRLGTIKKKEFVTIEGRNPGKAALFFGTNILDLKHKNLNQKHLAALTLFELAKIYNRRGFKNFLIGLVVETARSFQLLKESNFMFVRLIGYLTIVPMQILDLVKNYLLRAAEYKAADVVVGCGMGRYWLEAKEITGNRTAIINDRIFAPRSVQATEPRVSRAPYMGWFSGLLSPFNNYIDKHEWDFDDKSGSRFWAFFECVIEDAGKFLTELYLPSPMGPLLKNYVRQAMGTATLTDTSSLKEALTALDSKYATLCNQMPDQSAVYDPIRPGSNGRAQPLVLSRGPNWVNEDNTPVVASVAASRAVGGRRARH